MTQGNAGDMKTRSLGPAATRVARTAALLLGALFLWAVPSMSQVVNENLWGGGGVGSIARIGNTLYIAGGFARVGPSSGGGVPLDPSSGAPLRPYASVAGEVYACISDGAGGWFIGGDFSAVGGEPRANVAHLRRDGQLDQWRADADGRVNALLLDDRTLYMGGLFTHVAGQPRCYLAAVSVGCGSLLRWDSKVSGIGSDYSAVNALLLRGKTLYVAGDFATVGGAARRNLAALDVSNGRALGFAPDPDGRIYTLAAEDSLLYVGGGFHTIGGGERQYLAALSLVTGNVQAWDPRVGSARYDYDVWPYVHSLAIASGCLYVAGHFTRAGGQVRGGIASLNLVTGNATDWNPNPVNEPALGSAPFIYAVVVRDGLAYVGGRFDTLGSKPRLNLGAVTLTTGLATDFDPKVGDDVHALAWSGDALYAGGQFTTLWDWQPRNGLAAIDLTTGRLLPWNPDPGGGYVTTIAADGHAVYVGGVFSRINGEPRSNIAALDPASGAPTPWNPGSDGFVYALAPCDGVIYVGGWFTAIGGLLRRGIAALDGATGVPTAWDPGEGGVVETILPAGPTVYVGGSFSSIGGQARHGLAEVDATSGSATPWDPEPDGTVLTLAVAGDVVYAGGYFWQIGGASRTAIAALDRRTGLATIWNPEPADSPDFASPHVNSILASDGAIYAAGDFRRIGGEVRYFVAALDTSKGRALPWDAGAFGGAVLCLLEHQDTIYLGGALTRLGRLPVAGIGACSAVPPPQAATPRLTLRQCFPNPVTTSTTVAFSLPVDEDATLTIYDLQGRLIATPLEHTQRPAGPQFVTVGVGGWPAGCYLYRLEAGGASATRKMLVIK